jgi:hypothetical protein
MEDKNHWFWLVRTEMQPDLTFEIRNWYYFLKELDLEPISWFCFDVELEPFEIFS